MSIKTKYYNLEAFTWGDIYSSRVDKRRFTVIDNQLAFLSDIIESGLILGWDIVNNKDGTISVSPGMGMIDRRVVQSFGNFNINLEDNVTRYLLMEAKASQVGGNSGNSNIVSVTASDSISPSAPVGLQQVNNMENYLDSLTSYGSDLLDYLKELMNRRAKEDNVDLILYSQLAFSWDANIEPDFSYYSV